MTATSFTRMDESTKEQWDKIGEASIEARATVPDRVIDMLRGLEPIVNAFAVNQLVHSLQTATRAERAGADDEIVAASLCHDIGKVVTDVNHPAIAADILAPFVRPDVAWMIRVHQDFQGRHYYGYFGKDPQAREQYLGHPAYDLAEQFADEWDQASFDPDYDTLPLEHFEPVVRKIFSAPRYG